MQVCELIVLLQQQDPNSTVEEAFGKPALLVAREHVARGFNNTARTQRISREIRPALKVAPIEPRVLEEVLQLSAEWARDPIAFFRLWRIKSDVVQADSQTTNEDMSRLLCVPAAADSANTQHMRSLLWRNIKQMRNLGARRQEVAMRQILSAILFYDVVMAQSPRRQQDSGLPTGGMGGLVSRAWKQMTEEDLDKETAQEVVSYVKVGHRCHHVGEAVGQGSWLLIPEQVLRIGKQHSVKDVQETPKLFAQIRDFVQDSPIASTAASYIRQVQLRPFERLSKKRRTADALCPGRGLKRLMPSDGRALRRASSRLVPSQQPPSDSLVPPTQRERSGLQTYDRSDRSDVMTGSCDRELIAADSGRRSIDSRSSSNSDSDTASTPPTAGLVERSSVDAVVRNSGNASVGERGCEVDATTHAVDVSGGLSSTAASGSVLALEALPRTLGTHAAGDRCSDLEEIIIGTDDRASDYGHAQPTALSLPSAPSTSSSSSMFFLPGSPQHIQHSALDPAQHAHHSLPLTYACTLTSVLDAAGLTVFGVGEVS